MRCILLLLLLGTASCDGSGEAPGNERAREPLDVPVPSGPPVAQQVGPAAVPDTSGNGTPRWESATGEEGTILRLVGPQGGLVMSLACRAGSGTLAARIPAFRPIASEDRLSLALGAKTVTLAADPAGSEAGLVARGAMPADLAGDLENAKRIFALYGAQRSGPHPAPPQQLGEAFASTCR